MGLAGGGATATRISFNIYRTPMQTQAKCSNAPQNNDGDQCTDFLGGQTATADGDEHGATTEK